MSLRLPKYGLRRRDLQSTRKRARLHALLWFLLLSLALVAVALAVLQSRITGVTALVIEMLIVAALFVGGRALLVRTSPPKIPIVNYHSVSSAPGWLPHGNDISISPRQFESHLAYLKRRGYTSLFLGEVHDMIAGREPMDSNGRYVALTFDDGYADNWVAAFPLLKKYDMKGTFFVSTDFVGDDGTQRRTLEDVWNGEIPGEEDLDWEGYLTWDEMREMERSGLAQIEAHSEQHTRVFCDGEIIDFNSPAMTNLWMYWDEHRDLKPAWWKQDESTETGLWGSPVYRQAPALASRAFVPAPEIAACARRAVAEQGPAFFDRPDWPDALSAKVRTQTGNGGAKGRRETEEDYRRRVEEELGGCKRILEDRLNKEIRFMCWPEDAFSAIGEESARKLGYAATVSNLHDGTNSVGDSPARLARVAVGSHAAGFPCRVCDFLLFVFSIKIFEGRYYCYAFLLVLTLIRTAVSAIRRE
ncbi:polysaccharide deacetylase family protein [Planctomycetota bacterium]